MLCFPLDVPADLQAVLATLLSGAELARAARFHSRLHGARFTVAHARLRQVLGGVLGVAPERVEFAAAEHGKPRLADAEASCSLRFNLSHSDDLGLIGWARSREIGVDIERWRPVRDEAALVHRFFSAAEIRAYQALPAECRTEGFFHCWTRKEAYVKAVGRGLGLPLSSFDVTLDALDAQLLRPSAVHEDGRSWRLAAPPGPPRASLAVVLEAQQDFTCLE